MDLSGWEWLTVASRWFLYIGMSVAIGGAASQVLMRVCADLGASLRRYTLAGIVLGGVSLAVHFLIRVGALAEQGLDGLFDSLMLQILWQSTVGDALVLRAAGFLLLLKALLLGRALRPTTARQAAEGVLALAGMALIAFSYAQTGHIGELGYLAAVLLSVHILLAAWWMGSLYPLWLAGHRLPLWHAQGVLHRFGQLAVVAVLVLLAAGTALSYLLTGWDNLLGSDYGFWLLLKVGLVALILLLAALHKLVLVPALARAQDARALKRSLLLEKLLGAGILGITTILTTLVGPGH